jgi:hypothetical protein
VVITLVNENGGFEQNLYATKFEESVSEQTAHPDSLPEID